MDEGQRALAGLSRRSSGLSSGPAGFAILVGFSPGAHEWMPLM
jgi:hypothetical protein